MEAILYFLVPAVLLLGLWFWKIRSGQISHDEAKHLLSEGAAVVDVRTPAEFQREHLKTALNLPLDELEERIVEVASAKTTPLLLHCLSGSRSAVACARLRSLGYSRAHNLGGLARARQIIEGS